MFGPGSETSNAVGNLPSLPPAPVQPVLLQTVLHTIQGVKG